MKKLLLTFMLVPVVIISGCGDEDGSEKQYERIGGAGNTHFVYVEPELAGDKTGQRAIGKEVCEEYKDVDYCEVYMWDNKDNVQTSLPIMKTSVPMGLYTNKKGEVKLKVLGSNEEE